MKNLSFRTTSLTKRSTAWSGLPLGLVVTLLLIQSSVLAMQQSKTVTQVQIETGIERFNTGRIGEAYTTFIDILAAGSPATAQQQATAARYLAQMNRQDLMANNKSNRELMINYYQNLAEQAVDENTRNHLQHSSSTVLGMSLLDSEEYEKARFCFEIVAHSSPEHTERIMALRYLMKICNEGWGGPKDPKLADFYALLADEASLEYAAENAHSTQAVKEPGLNEEKPQLDENYDSYMSDFRSLLQSIKLVREESNGADQLPLVDTVERTNTIHRIVERTTILALKFASFNEATRIAIAEECPALLTLNSVLQDNTAYVASSRHSLENVLQSEVTDILPLVLPSAVSFMQKTLIGIREKKVKKSSIKNLYLLDYFLTKGEWEEPFLDVTLDKDGVMVEAVILLGKCLCAAGKPHLTAASQVNLEALKEAFAEYKSLTLGSKKDRHDDAEKRESAVQRRVQLRDFLLVEYERLDKGEKDTINKYLISEEIHMQDLLSENKMLVTLLKKFDRVGQGKSRSVNDALMLALGIFACSPPCESRFKSSLVQLISKKLHDGKLAALIGPNHLRKALSIAAATTYVLFKTVEQLSHSYGTKSTALSSGLPFTTDILEAFELQKKDASARKKQHSHKARSEKKELEILCTAELRESESGCIYCTVMSGKAPFTCSIDSGITISSSSRTFSIRGLTPGKKHILVRDALKNKAELDITISRPAPLKKPQRLNPNERLQRAQEELKSRQASAQTKKNHEEAHQADVARMAREEKARQVEEKARKASQDNNVVSARKQNEEESELAQSEMLRARELEMKRMAEEELQRVAQKKEKQAAASHSNSTRAGKGTHSGPGVFPPELQRRVLNGEPAAARQVLNLYGNDPLKITTYVGMPIEELVALANKK